MLPNDSNALLAGRVWRPNIGPCVVTVRGDRVIDITSKSIPTMRDLCEGDSPADILRTAPGEDIGSVADMTPHLLAPVDLHAIKACGVTFADSMVERVIEEQADGDPERANAIRQKVGKNIGDSLSGLKPGSAEAEKVKSVLQAEGLWSQYLEVGIGPYAEVFTKSQPMSAVGYGADVGLHPISKWNNPEPEVVLCITSQGTIIGATLGNDVNLRDVEGRSALLLGKAKDNNASCAIGPFIRVFDDHYTLDDVRRAELTMTVTGEDDFILDGTSSMTKISRDPADLAQQTIGRHHQYPDGFVLFCGTMFAPTKDRDAPGQGFTHHTGDVVEIQEPHLGTLRNTVRLSTECPEWTFGTAALMRNLAGRGLL
ncbi:fumarylacetoacetate hydrolase family protein [Marivita hallyeonensis]|uniref:Fumarylacetoacetate (FAA) hydrolase family protein n=1 Tax=Marivita hallyeonensis TaxID=996342 RepID=A0A1M5Y1F9_9RHOB|nr:fumarylacetoacetate hydrolase family protein [Marivita hallyeonensis]SHI05779.1 Fumarylacetoacetate (FAA) hydrolase family protein [Marivita hallyeonensis]